MKRYTSYKIVAAPLLALAVFAAACGSIPPAETGADASQSKSEEARLPNGYTLRRSTSSVPLAEKQTRDDPRLNISFIFLEPKKPDREAEFLKGLLYSGNSAKQYQNALAGEYQDMYRQDPPEAVSGSLPADWEYRENLAVRGMGESGVTLARKKYVYTGGTHGMQTTTYYVIDREALTVLKLPDFFRDPQGAELRALVMEELRLYSGLEPDRPLSEGIFFRDEPEISSNFFVTEEGLGLHWNPYDIAPYSEGSVEITLPWRTLRPLLKQEAMERLTKFGINLFVS
ncbi:MAG: RsiV family protein [Treponema sp.]|jgi:hypothetical protein|nr:RsiV family protein [Treponema sp.]